MAQLSEVSPEADGTVYSVRKDYCPFSTPPLETYAALVGDEKVERLRRVAERLKGLQLLEINATAQGGGVAEMLYSAIPFLNALGVEAEWKIINGSPGFFEVTKSLHNMIQGKKEVMTADMVGTYVKTLEQCANDGLIDYDPDLVMVHDPQPMGLADYLTAMDMLLAATATRKLPPEAIITFHPWFRLGRRT